jgi:hypothetical protein
MISVAKSFASQNMYCTDASHKTTSCDTSILDSQRILLAKLDYHLYLDRNVENQ